MQNVLVEEGTDLLVYVRCAECHAFIARYQVNRCYHHGKGLDSYLKSLPSFDLSSGYAILEELAALRADAVSGYQMVTKAIESNGQ